jgi:hypothetical protein
MTCRRRTFLSVRKEITMKKTALVLSAIACSFLLAGGAFAADDVVEIVAQGCKAEIETHCKDVKVGQGRVLACLYAYSDRLSSRCEYALYDASVLLQRQIAALTYLANECKDDLKTFCSGVKAGEGRLLECMKKNQNVLGARCTEALKDVAAK